MNIKSSHQRLLRRISSTISVVSSPAYLLLYLLPILLYFGLELYGHARYWRDPHSPYFDNEKAWQSRYSDTRSEEANAFLDHHVNTTFRRSEEVASLKPRICLGMLTVARPDGAMYFPTSLGSVLAGLTQKERDELYVMPFITHTDPMKHPAYNEPWLEHITDRILLYNETDVEKYRHIVELEKERDRTGTPDREKHLSDYTYLMRQCGATGADYVLMMEDDVVALDGWFHRAKDGLIEAEEKTLLSRAKDFFYLRLFYYESILSKFDEDKRLHDRRMSLYGAIVLVAFAITFLRNRPMIRSNIPIFASVTYLLLYISIDFYYKGWYISTVPPSPSVQPLTACCAQSLIFPASKVPILTAIYDKARIGFVDTIAEEWAASEDGRDLAGERYALTPVVMQHIGKKSSKGDNWGSDKPGEMSAAERIWNFGFELNNAKALAREHKRVDPSYVSGIGV